MTNVLVIERKLLTLDPLTQKSGQMTIYNINNVVMSDNPTNAKLATLYPLLPELQMATRWK